MNPVVAGKVAKEAMGIAGHATKSAWSAFSGEKPGWEGVRKGVFGILAAVCFAGVALSSHNDGVENSKSKKPPAVANRVTIKPGDETRVIEYTTGMNKTCDTSVTTRSSVKVTETLEVYGILAEPVMAETTVDTPTTFEICVDATDIQVGVTVHPDRSAVATLNIPPEAVSVEAQFVPDKEESYTEKTPEKKAVDGTAEAAQGIGEILLRNIQKAYESVPGDMARINGMVADISAHKVGAMGKTDDKNRRDRETLAELIGQQKAWVDCGPEVIKRAQSHIGDTVELVFQNGVDSVIALDDGGLPFDDVVTKVLVGGEDREDISFVPSVKGLDDSIAQMKKQVDGNRSSATPVDITVGATGCIIPDIFEEDPVTATGGRKIR